MFKTFSRETNQAIEAIDAAIDRIDTSDEEKFKAKNELRGIVLGAALSDIQNAQRDIILAETRGRWLQRSWRPIVMLCFAFVVVYVYFIDPAFVNSDPPVSDRIYDRFWGLLELGIGGYVVGRSAEKITTTLSQNNGLPFMNRTNRKDG